MNDADKRNRRIQAQLRHLGLYTRAIDGVWGNLPRNQTSSLSNTRRAIYNFKANNHLLETVEGQDFVPANYDMTENDEAELNTQAPMQINA